jgi:DeoR/GlpR family transcriptional regulator of sugar metabolism
MTVLPNFRQQQIVEIARATGRVVVDDLAARFEVTPQTIRKDLNELCDQRLLSRIHGGAAVDFIRQFKVDHAVIGASAIDEEGALLDFDYREVRVSQAIIGNARQVILVSDRLKFERSAPVRIGHISQIDVFVTDELVSAPIADLCRAQGVRVIETRAATVERG